MTSCFTSRSIASMRAMSKTASRPFSQTLAAASFGTRPSSAIASSACASISNQMRNFVCGRPDVGHLRPAVARDHPGLRSCRDGIAERARFFNAGRRAMSDGERPTTSGRPSGSDQRGGDREHVVERAGAWKWPKIRKAILIGISLRSVMARTTCSAIADRRERRPCRRKARPECAAKRALHGRRAKQPARRRARRPAESVAGDAEDDGSPPASASRRPGRGRARRSAKASAMADAESRGESRAGERLQPASPPRARRSRRRRSGPSAAVASARPCGSRRCSRA